MRRIAPPHSLFCLSMFFLCLTGEVAQAGHGVRIGARDTTESAILAAIAAELVQSALDVPILIPPLANSGAAWQAIQKGDIDVYPESIAVLAEQVLHDPDAGSIDHLRSALAKYRVRVTDPVGDIVLLYRADLPERIPASALMLLQMPRLVGPADLQGMIARSREDRVPASAIAADFLRAQLQSPPARRTAAKPLYWGAALLAALLGILAARRLRLSGRHQVAAPAPAVLRCACPSPGPACR